MPLHCSLLTSFLKKGIQNWTQTLDVFWEVFSRAIYHFSHPPDCISVNTDQDAVDLLCPQCTLLGSMHLNSTAHQDLQVFFSGGRFTVSTFPALSVYCCQQFFPRQWPAFAFSKFQNVPVVSSTFRSLLDGIPTFKTYWLLLPSLHFISANLTKALCSTL